MTELNKRFVPGNVNGHLVSTTSTGGKPGFTTLDAAKDAKDAKNDMDDDEPVRKCTPHDTTPRLMIRHVMCPAWQREGGGDPGVNITAFVTNGCSIRRRRVRRRLKGRPKKRRRHKHKEHPELWPDQSRAMRQVSFVYVMLRVCILKELKAPPHVVLLCAGFRVTPCWLPCPLALPSQEYVPPDVIAAETALAQFPASCGSLEAYCERLSALVKVCDVNAVCGGGSWHSIITSADCLPGHSHHGSVLPLQSPSRRRVQSPASKAQRPRHSRQAAGVCCR